MTVIGRPIVEQAKALELAARPNGVSHAELVEAIGFNYACAKAMTWRLRHAGKVFASRGSSTTGKRYFTDKQSAMTYEVPVFKPKKPRASRRIPKELHKVRRAEEQRTLAIKMAAGPDGVTSAALAKAAGKESNAVGKLLERMEKEGLLFRAKSSKWPIHFFLSAERASSYVRPEPPPRVRPSKAKTKSEHKPKGGAAQKLKRLAGLRDPSIGAISPHWRTNAPQKQVYLPKETAATKRITLPHAPVYARHQVPEGQAVPSVVNPAECRPWANHAIGAR